MATLTAYSGTADGQIDSVDQTYATARSGGTLTATSSGYAIATGQSVFTQQQRTSYRCYEVFIGFDTSSIGSTSTIDSATLSLYGSIDLSTTDFTINARYYDWGTSVTTADWIAGASLSGNTLFGTFATSGFSTTAYNDFTTSSAASISKTATTNLVLSSSRHEGNNTPTVNEYVQVFSADQIGTTQDPKLVVNYTPVVTVNVTGVTGTADADGQAGTVAAVRIANVTGVLSTTASEGLAGSVTAVRIANVTGVLSTTASEGLAGSVTAVRIANVGGVLATSDANALSGTVAAQIQASISGQTATTDAEAFGGSVEFSSYAVVTISGAITNAPAEGLAGAVFISTTIIGEASSVDADTFSGQVATQRIVTISGDVAVSDAVALSGTVQAQVQIAISGALSTTLADGKAGTVSTVRIVTLNGVMATASAVANAGILMPVVIKENNLAVYPGVWANRHAMGKNWKPPVRRRPW